MRSEPPVLYRRPYYAIDKATLNELLHFNYLPLSPFLGFVSEKLGHGIIVWVYLK